MATARKSKNAENERLDSAHIEKVIALLENKGTKKAACEILNISYNTTRLNSIIEKYKDNKAKEAAMRAEKRGKPATTAEIQYVIQGYLEGNTVENLSNSIYRSASFVSGILERFSVPKRSSPHNYFSPGLVPETAIKDSFQPGEKVYSMRYDSLAKIISEWAPEKKYTPKVYCIFLMSDKWKEFAYQEAWELASLDHLKELGINV